MPCSGPFHFSYRVDYFYDFCPLPDPDVGLSIFVCDVEHTSFHFGLCGRKFVLLHLLQPNALSDLHNAVFLLRLKIIIAVHYLEYE